MRFIMKTTKPSIKGQIILPASIRTADGVLLRPLKAVAASALDNVIGCAGYKGEAQSVADMDAAISAELKARHPGHTRG